MIKSIYFFDIDGASVLHTSEAREHEDHAHRAAPASAGHGEKRQEEHKGMFPALCGCNWVEEDFFFDKKGFKMLDFSLPPARGTFTRA